MNSIVATESATIAPPIATIKVLPDAQFFRIPFQLAPGQGVGLGSIRAAETGANNRGTSGLVKSFFKSVVMTEREQIPYVLDRAPNDHDPICIHE